MWTVFSQRYGMRRLCAGRLRSPAQQRYFLFEEPDLSSLGRLVPSTRLRSSAVLVGLLWPTTGTIVLHVGTSSRISTYPHGTGVDRQKKTIHISEPSRHTSETDTVGSGLGHLGA